MTGAADRWRRDLEAWALPDWLMAGAEDSPYGWSQAVWKRRSEEAALQPDTPTTVRVRSFLNAGGGLLDVGAGRGRASLPHAVEGAQLTAVEPDPGMAAGLCEDAAALGLSVDVVQERWPQARRSIGSVNVAMSAHVVYDVAEIAEFVAGLDDVADIGVVIELSERHPWSDLTPLYQQVHGLERPAGPTADDLVEVIGETVGRKPWIEKWSRPGQIWFEGWDELCDFFGRRLVVPRAARPGLKAILEDRVIEDSGRLVVGGDERRLATIWWETA